MPVAIVISDDGAIPAILMEKSDALLVERLSTLQGAPELHGPADARKWLFGLPEPSGWFASVDEAHAYLDRVRKPPSDMTGAEMKQIRTGLGMTRAEFAAALGFGGSDSTKHNHVFKMESGSKPIMQERARAARALAAGRELDAATAR